MAVFELSGKAPDLQGYELFLLLKLQNDIEFWFEWDKFWKIYGEHNGQFPSLKYKDLPVNLWYVAVAFDFKKERLLQFVKEQKEKAADAIDTLSFRRVRENILLNYLNFYQFTELHLDGIYRSGEDTTLPVEIFKCESVQRLSLKYNHLVRLPPDIGRLKNLEYLSLTNNRLQNKSIPYTLTFCKSLKALFVDNNLLDAVPGFLLKMKSLDTLHRHGNHNYFKTTFMAYHTDVNERILFAVGDYPPPPVSKDPKSLQFLAASATVGAKLNFYDDPNVPTVMKTYISEIYDMFRVCEFCDKAKLTTESGYKVVTFKNPFLGNTCVPFQHWTCCLSCAIAIEVPARHEQIKMATEQNLRYRDYVAQFNKPITMKRRRKCRFYDASDDDFEQHSILEKSGHIECQWKYRMDVLPQRRNDPIKYKANCCCLM